MSKTSSAGGGQIQGAPPRIPRRGENGVRGLPTALLNGMVGDSGEHFHNMASGGGERVDTRPNMSTGTPSSRGTATRNSATFQERRVSGAGAATAVSYVYERPHHPVQGGGASSSSRARKFIDSRTTPLVRLLFHRTFTQANLDKEVIRKLDVEPQVKRLSQSDRSFVQETCEKYLEYLKSSDAISIDSHRRAIESSGWNISDNNVDAEFKKVVNETFDENVTWGSVIGFLGFALGFSIFIHNKGMKRAVISVAEWTRQVIEEDIGNFFLKNNGWVSVCVCACVPSECI